MIINKRKQVEHLLGVALPASVKDIHFKKWCPKSDLSYYEAYLRVESSFEDYLDYTAQLGLKAQNESAHLPTGWSSPAEITLPWWEANKETPDNALAADFIANGYIVAKYENGYSYFIIHGGMDEMNFGPW